MQHREQSNLIGVSKILASLELIVTNDCKLASLIIDVTDTLVIDDVNLSILAVHANAVPIIPVVL